jgi:uncharacterized lipoprotein YmbA
MTLRSSLTTLTLVVVVLLGLGCSSGPPTHYYVLEAQQQAAAATDDEGISIGVRTFRVDPPYDDDRIVYRIGESPEIGFYHYHRWAAPLSRMLPTVISESLSGTEGVSRIEPAGPTTDYDFNLYGRVVKAEEIDTVGQQQVTLQIELRLNDLTGAELWSGLVAADGTTQTEELSDIIDAMSAALGTALEPIRIELGQLATGL